ncbi:hypothetical protein ACH4T9_12975 [Micromonospora sp. NPDC020750]|uniref:hypothetical protein n=1 Tax=unclassified Micromonospora TaxID=2617518 RepID=UPI00379FE02E
MTAPNLMAVVWTAIVVDQWGEVWPASGSLPAHHHRIMVVRALLTDGRVEDIQYQQVLYEAQGWKDPAVEWAEAQAVAAALTKVQQPTPDLRVVRAEVAEDIGDAILTHFPTDNRTAVQAARIARHHATAYDDPETSR